MKGYMKKRLALGATSTVVVNRWIDLIDRTAWAFVLSFASSLIALGFDDWKTAASIAGGVALGALVKTGAAQNIGDSPLGDAVPGASAVVEKQQA